MHQLPIRTLTLYKQGIGAFERRGTVTGSSVVLSLPRAVTNDVLKSLTLTIHQGGPLHSVDYETPTEQDRVLDQLPFTLGERSSLVDLLVQLRGCTVTLQRHDDTSVSGRILGVETSLDPAAHPPVVLMQHEHGIAMLPLAAIRQLTLHDPRAATDVAFFLDVSRSEQHRTALTVRLGAGSHDLSLHYVAPCPTWRVSYRLLGDGEGQARLLGWGLFENALDEDLVAVDLTLISGRPISFDYQLADARIPARPQVVDDPAALEQVAGNPLVAESLASISHELRSPLTTMLGYAMLLEREMAGTLTPEQKEMVRFMRQGAERMQDQLSNLLDLLRLKSTGHDLSSFLVQSGPLGDLKVSASYFLPLLLGNAEQASLTYHVPTPVSVGRGQSAMVPIVDTSLTYRELCVFNGAKMANHPLRVWQLENTTGVALEQGPVTVREGGQYRGEGIIRFSGVGDELQIPFALEFGILVTQQRETLPRRLWAVTLNRQERRAQVVWAHIHEERYLLVSRVEREITVRIEHRDPNRGVYADMPAPELASRGHTRWPVVVPPQGEAHFTVCERHLVSTLEDIATWQAPSVEELRAAGGLPDPLYDQLRRLLAEQQRSAAATLQIQALQAEYLQLAGRQEQLRKNLAALGDAAREAELRNRVLEDLAASEDRRRAIEASQVAAETAARDAQAQQADILSAICA